MFFFATSKSIQIRGMSKYDVFVDEYHTVICKITHCPIICDSYSKKKNIVEHEDYCYTARKFE